MSVKEDIEALRVIAADPDFFDCHDRLGNCDRITRVLDACEKMQDISSYELTKIASKHVIGVVGGGMIDFDECQEAIETYLKEVRGE